MKASVYCIVKQVGVGLVGLCCMVPWAQAAVWPDRPVTIVVPYPPGGVTDSLGRLLAKDLSTSLGQPVLVENKSGAGGLIGAEYVSRAKPDGYTLLIGGIAQFGIAPAMYSHLNYDTRKSFDAVAMIATIPSVFVVGSKSAFSTMKDYIDAAKEKPEGLTFGSGGNGTSLHMSGELLQAVTGIQLIHIPYRGDAPALQALLARQIDSLFSPLSSCGPHIEAGSVRPLAVTSTKRLPALSDVPTMLEAGVPDFIVEQWQGVFAPGGTPVAVITRLNGEINTILRSRELSDKLTAMGASPAPMSPEEVRAYQNSDEQRWKKVVEDNGIQKFN